jgi:hypothetical protein
VPEIILDDLEEVDNADPYEWDKTMREDQQADDYKKGGNNIKGYVNYLKENIKIPVGTSFYDCKSKKKLFFLKDELLSFDMSGTTDVIIVKNSHINALDLRSGIQAGFELKKAIQEVHTHQAVAQLFIANIFSKSPVFIVLTDLNNDWYFYWLSREDNELKVMQIKVGLKKAIFLIQAAFGTNDNTFDTNDNNDNALSSRCNLSHIRKVRDSEARKNVDRSEEEHVEISEEESVEINEEENVEINEEENVEEENVEISERDVNITRVRNVEVIRGGGVGSSRNVSSQLDLFVNRPKFDLDFDDDVGNMRDVFDVMSEEEILNWKVRRTIRFLKDNGVLPDEDDNKYLSMYL